MIQPDRERIAWESYRERAWGNLNNQLPPSEDIFKAGYRAALALPTHIAKPLGEAVEETLTDALRAAFIAGCEAVHEHYEPNPDPEFGEAGDDYAASVLRSVLNALQSEGKA
jgi:hypothetical protein